MPHVLTIALLVIGLYVGSPAQESGPGEPAAADVVWSYDTGG